MAIEIIFQSQSSKDEVEIQTLTSKWTFPAMQDEGSKKDLPDHTRIIFRESKCLMSDFDTYTFLIKTISFENLNFMFIFQLCGQMRGKVIKLYSNNNQEILN